MSLEREIQKLRAVKLSRLQREIRKLRKQMLLNYADKVSYTFIGARTSPTIKDILNVTANLLRR